MSKHNKTEFTLTTLEAAHKLAIQQYLACVKIGDTAAESRWHNECARLERLIVAKRKAADEATDRALAEVDLIKEFSDLGLDIELEDVEFADGQNVLMRKTDMKQNELDAAAAESWEQNYDKDCPALDYVEPPKEVQPLYVEDLWFKDGVAFGRTPSCGCCSDYMSSDVDEYDYNPTMGDLDRMAAYVEQQEAKVQAMREDFNDYCNSQENG